MTSLTKERKLKTPRFWLIISSMWQKWLSSRGVEFGADPFERLSYATSMEDIKEGVNRIEEALKKLS